jgi:hypothetical protein
LEENEAKINEELIGTQESHKRLGYYQPNAELTNETTPKYNIECHNS